jgi:hypothetical protein
MIRRLPLRLTLILRTLLRAYRWRLDGSSGCVVTHRMTQRTEKQNQSYRDDYTPNWPIDQKFSLGDIAAAFVVHPQRHLGAFARRRKS